MFHFARMEVFKQPLSQSTLVSSELRIIWKYTISLHVNENVKIPTNAKDHFEFTLFVQAYRRRRAQLRYIPEEFAHSVTVMRILLRRPPMPMTKYHCDNLIGFWGVPQRYLSSKLAYIGKNVCVVFAREFLLLATQKS